jgi:hypothetical protein
MAQYFEALDGRDPDEGFVVLEEVFHLEDQLATARGDGTRPHHASEIDRDDTP